MQFQSQGSSSKMFNRMGTQDRIALQGVMKSKDEAFLNAQS